MNISSKQVEFADAPALFRRLRSEGKRIVQCHGTFDMVHPGHILHFEEAKALGDVLVVTLTSERHVNKGPGRPYFNDQLRVKWLAALECVDYVVVIPHAAAVEAIECVCPHIYCKGKEYEVPGADPTGNFADDVRTVKRLGGEIRYVGSVVFSSTRLLNTHFQTYSPSVKAFCKSVAARFPPAEVRRIIERFASLKVLVVGDLIFDRYTTVTVQGLTSKNKILSARYMADEIQAGGALAVYRHVSQFTPHARLLTLAGTEPWVEPELRKYINPDKHDVIRVPAFTTIVKQRFVEPLHEGHELSKLFSVNYIDPQHPGADVCNAVLDRLAGCIGEFDVVMVMDFGHGLMQAPVRELAQQKAAFLALNCQTNSNNYGFNLINRQYQRADSFSLDQREICLAIGNRDVDFHPALASIKTTLGARYAWLTRGEIETLGLKNGEPPSSCPPFEMNVVDTVGAGDAFCSLASLAAALDLPVDLATFLGQLAGAMKVRIIGNSRPIRKGDFIKGAETMLNF